MLDRASKSRIYRRDVVASVMEDGCDVMEESESKAASRLPGASSERTSQGVKIGRSECPRLRVLAYIYAFLFKCAMCDGYFLLRMMRLREPCQSSRNQ